MTASKLDDDDCRHMLLSIRRSLLEHYPFTEANSEAIDARYAMAFGLIAGICTEAIQAIQQGRKARFVIETSS
jgi:hypothetical protein